MADSKDTIYIDIDDEITGIIDKVRGSKGKLVALVLPKRAGVFQSIVNMKLLKRSADDAKKHLVLITSEAGLLPLAGAAGIHVAKTLNSKPVIPVGPSLDDTEEETVDETGDIEEIDPEAAANEPIGKLAGAAAAGAVAGAVASDGDDVETLELDNAEADAVAPKSKDFTPPAKGKKAKKPKKDKKLAIPDFDRFRMLLIVGGAMLAAFIVFLIFAIFVLPKATIAAKTDATSVPINLTMNLSTTTTELDTENNTVPAKQVSQQKTYTQTVATTGQKNNGNKASGQVSITNCSDSTATVAAGTGLSSNGNTYITQQSVDVPGSDFNSHGGCKNNSKATVNVLAQSGGTAYNLPGGSNFTIAGGSSTLTGQGSGISGGTDSVVHTVNQNDITTAKSKVNTSDPDIKKDLQEQLKKAGYYAITATFSPGTPTTTTSANVGDVANNVTVTEVVTYTMFGAYEKDLNTLIDNQIKGQIDTNKQSILSRGLDTATYNISGSNATSVQLGLTTNATVGPDLDINSIKQDAAGKKPSEVKSQLSSNPDVTDVEVKLSPFWVSAVPKKESKIKVVIAKPATTKSTNNGSSQ